MLFCLVMYEFIRGKLHSITPTYAVIDCNGVGYHLSISLFTYSQVKDKQTFYCTQAIKPEILRFSALRMTEKRAFRLLISVSGWALQRPG